ncbi:MAG: hypothetical protein LIQ30_09450, partial [Planctomycetes bacterium]|nr:hypothetical protein [Planctomycetota bacterium]
MASKKEHKRKQKHKNTTSNDTNGARPRFFQGQELNSLDLSTVLGIKPKGDTDSATADPHDDLAAQAVREAEEQAKKQAEEEARRAEEEKRRREEEEARAAEQARREAEEQAKKQAEEEARRA